MCGSEVAFTDVRVQTNAASEEDKRMKGEKPIEKKCYQITIFCYHPLHQLKCVWWATTILVKFKGTTDSLKQGDAGWMPTGEPKWWVTTLATCSSGPFHSTPKPPSPGCPQRSRPWTVEPSRAPHCQCIALPLWRAGQCSGCLHLQSSVPSHTQREGVVPVRSRHPPHACGCFAVWRAQSIVIRCFPWCSCDSTGASDG